MTTHFESALEALGIDLRHAADGVYAEHPFVVPLALASKGFRSFPAYRDSKTPRIRDWPLKASSDPLVLCQWHKTFTPPKAEFSPNWLVLTGRDGGLWLIDVDGAQGRADLANLESELGSLPVTWTVESGRVGGGEHRWFKPTPNSDVELMNQQHMFGHSIDIRAWHGYAVLPSSIHAQTRLRYRWREGHGPDDLGMAELPPAWLEFLPKKILGAEQDNRRTYGGRRAGSRPAYTSMPQTRGSRVIGDGEGGFQNAIFLNAIDYWRDAGTDASEEQLVSTLWESIQAAPKAPGRTVERYRPGNGDLERAVNRARDFVEGLNVEHQERESE